MGKESGRKVLLKIGDGATPTEVFTALSGQKVTNLQLGADDVDTSDKTTGAWGTSLAGTLNGQITTSGVCNWPDTTGLAALRAKFLAQETINCEAIENAAGDKWKGAFSITQFNINGDMGSATSYDITLKAAGVLTHVNGV